jgi:hypothetical protein
VYRSFNVTAGLIESPCIQSWNQDMILPGIDEQADAQHHSRRLDPADLPHQIEVGFANGKTGRKCKEAEITVQTEYRWRKEYGAEVPARTF